MLFPEMDTGAPAPSERTVEVLPCQKSFIIFDGVRYRWPKISLDDFFESNQRSSTVKYHVTLRKPLLSLDTIQIELV
jgi:hypothetical protein